MANTPIPRQTVRLIYGVLLTSPVLAGLVVSALVTARPLGAVGGPIVLGAMLGAAATAAVLAVLMRAKVPARARGEGEEDYWAATFPRALLVWAPLESAGLLAVVAGLLSGDLLVLGVGLVVFLALMVAWSPGRLEGV